MEEDSLEKAEAAMRAAEESAEKVRAKVENAKQWGNAQFPSSTTEP